MRDIFNDALNAPPGQLAEVLISRAARGDGGEIPDEVRARLDRLIDAPGKQGLLARVRLAADLPYLFDRAQMGEVAAHTALRLVVAGCRGHLVGA